METDLTLLTLMYRKQVQEQILQIREQIQMMTIQNMVP